MAGSSESKDQVARYRKKPVEIEAVQVHRHNARYVMDWVGHDALSITQTFDTGINIKTKEGVIHASWGCFVIKGVHGEFYPCDPEIFHKTYEKVGEEDSEEPCPHCGHY